MFSGIHDTPHLILSETKYLSVLGIPRVFFIGTLIWFSSDIPLKTLYERTSGSFGTRRGRLPSSLLFYRPSPLRRCSIMFSMHNCSLFNYHLYTITSLAASNFFSTNLGFFSISQWKTYVLFISSSYTFQEIVCAHGHVFVR